MMDMDDRKKSSKKVEKKKVNFFLSGKCLGCFGELSWVTNSPKKIFWSLGYEIFFSQNRMVVLRIDSY